MSGSAFLRGVRGCRHGLRALLLAAPAALVLVAGITLLSVPPAGATPGTDALSGERLSVEQQGEEIEDQSPLTAPVVTAPTILPKPNSGEKPKFEGARGTWPQYLIFGLTMGGVAVVFLLVTRESKKKRRLAATDSDPATVSDPVTASDPQ